MPIREEYIKKTTIFQQRDAENQRWEKHIKSDYEIVLRDRILALSVIRDALLIRLQESPFWKKHVPNFLQIVTAAADWLDHSYRGEKRRDEINPLTKKKELVVNHCLATAFGVVDILDTYHKHPRAFDAKSREKLDILSQHPTELLIEALFHDYKEDGKGEIRDLWNMPGASLEWYVSPEQQARINKDLPLLDKYRPQIIRKAISSHFNVPVKNLKQDLPDKNVIEFYKALNDVLPKSEMLFLKHEVRKAYLPPIAKNVRAVFIKTNDILDNAQSEHSKNQIIKYEEYFRFVAQQSPYVFHKLFQETWDNVFEANSCKHIPAIRECVSSVKSQVKNVIKLP